MEVQEEALQVLAQLARKQAIGGPIAAVGAIPSIVKLLSSTAKKVQERAATAVATQSGFHGGCQVGASCSWLRHPPRPLAEVQLSPHDIDGGVGIGQSRLR